MVTRTLTPEIINKFFGASGSGRQKIRSGSGGSPAVLRRFHFRGQYYPENSGSGVRGRFVRFRSGRFPASWRAAGEKIFLNLNFGAKMHYSAGAWKIGASGQGASVTSFHSSSIVALV